MLQTFVLNSGHPSTQSQGSCTVAATASPRRWQRDCKEVLVYRVQHNATKMWGWLCKQGVIWSFTSVARLMDFTRSPWSRKWEKGGRRERMNPLCTDGLLVSLIKVALTLGWKKVLNCFVALNKFLAEFYDLYRRDTEVCAKFKELVNVLLM